MLNKQLSIFASLIILLIGIFAFNPTMTAESQIILNPDGCDTLASLPDGLNVNAPLWESFVGTFAWQAGETINWQLSAGPVTGGVLIAVQSSIYDGIRGYNETQETTTGNSLSENGSYTFTTTGDYNINIGAADLSGNLNFNTVVFCGSAAAPSAAAVVDDTVYPPDARLNWQFGDLGAVFYRSADSAGNPAIDVYCYDGGISWLGMQANDATASGTSADGCDATFYILPEGGYQFNINYDGKLYEIRCSDFACEEPDMSYFDPNE